MSERLFTEKVNHPIAFEIDPEVADDDIPFGNSALPERGVVLLGHNKTEWNQESIHESIRLCRKRGLVPGAVVAAKPLLGSGNDWKVRSFVYWGIITHLNTYIPGQIYHAYAPITVRWLQPANHSNHAEDKLFPADLYLIHAALTEEAITSKMQQQQE